MPIYTRTGDKGTTALFGGRRVSKTDARIRASGSIDELTSWLGLLREKVKKGAERELLATIQKDLYEIMALTAGAALPIEFLQTGATEFEQIIDEYTSQLPALNSFILPGGTENAALFHVSRAVCRRAECDLIEAVILPKNTGPQALASTQYLNRLSDLLFTLARYHAKGKEVKVKA
jgi:cob(I)alamin adenosyltransferase